MNLPEDEINELCVLFRKLRQRSDRLRHILSYLKKLNIDSLDSEQVYTELQYIKLLSEELLDE